MKLKKGVKFFGDTVMIGKFDEDADFRSADFYGNADFSNTIFTDYSNFQEANFYSNANFRDATFYDDANFGSVNFSGDTIFSHSRFEKKLYFGTSKFEKHVYFDNIEFDKITVCWDSLKDALVYDGLFYVQLIKNFRDNEFFEEADDANYQYRRQRQAREEKSISWVFDVLIGSFCGYGLKPLQTILWSGLIILIFSCLFYKKQNKFFWNENERESDNFKSLMSSFSGFIQKIDGITPVLLKKIIPSWCSIYVSCVTFTTLGTMRPKNGKDRLALMIEGLLGWLFLTLFVITLTNVTIKP